MFCPAVFARSLKVYPLLVGYRGKPRCDLSAIIDQVLALQLVAEDNQLILVEAEINPHLCTPTTGIAAEAFFLTKLH